MHPVLFDFEIFGLAIRLSTFGVMVVVAFLVSAWVIRRRLVTDLGADREKAFNLCFYLLFVGIAGARLLHVLVHYAEYAKKPLSFLYIWDGGLAFYGGLIAGALWLAWYLPRHPEWKGSATADRVALGTGLALFLGGWGSFLTGQGHGKETDVAWAVTFPVEKHSAARMGVPLHPTQIYESLHGLLLFLLVAACLKRRVHPGRATALFLAAYALGRGILEVFRGDDSVRGMAVEGILSVPQVLSIPVLFAGIALWLVRRPPEGAGANAPS
jgi:phosphatidylglycerol:prolipoprotein diacylglycerol transferase